jgi:iron complex outermembrane receptor protein
MHISDPAQAGWLKERIEGYGKEISFTQMGRKAILNKLVEAEGFEKFLHVKYMGTKRFGLDGGEALIPAMEQIIKRGGALGAKPLDAEESVNFSLGAVIRFADVTITVDAYRIDIDDRIVLSENLTQANVREYLEGLGFIGVGGGRFFINGVDTETRGLDVVVNWPWLTDSAGKFDFTLVANWNDTEVTRVPTTQELAALDPPPPLFARVNVLTFEEGNPRDKFAAAANWSMGRFGATARVTRYGSALDPGTTAALDFELGSATLLDLEARFDATDRIRIALGADNLFDEYPDAFPVERNTTGNTPFSNYSPFGRSGRYVYGRLSIGF